MINDLDKILFIGLGGAGQRHLRIFRKLLPNNKFYALRKTFKTPLLNSDFTINNQSSISRKYNVKEFTDENYVKKINPKLTIISSPTKFHKKYTKLAFEIGSNVLVEKPGFTSKEEFNEINNFFYNSKLCYYVSFQRIYNPLFTKIRNIVKNNDFGELINGKVKVSSFVPDWHSYENHKELYACRKDLGGGALLTECHEINMICGLFGKPRNIKLSSIHNNKLNINVEDTIYIDAFFGNAKINFDISFMRKPLERSIFLCLKKGDIFLDLDKNQLILNKNNCEDIFSNSKSNDDFFISQAKEILKLKNKNKEILNNQKYFSSIIDEYN
tara:strand:- start:7 stop:990 length:984 start_codon:yes stop_codon:yes gene_type:complete